MTALLIAPEPAAWIGRVAEGVEGRVSIFAPWATRAPAPNWWPARLREFNDRRLLAGATTVPGWRLIEGGARIWAKSRAERKLRVRFALRESVDRIAALLVRRMRPTLVISPSVGARRSFAAAHSVGARRVLVEDMPDIRELHDDLDRAARAHPSCGFLNRYRASARSISRQEAERVLADEILVRGRFARELRVERGARAQIIKPLKATSAAPLPRWGQRPRRILLAGLAAARHGTVEALAAVDRLPGVMLVVRPGEGMEPADLLSRANVVADDGKGADVVIAPAWCESYPTEVARAAAAGIPIIATSRAAGFVDVTEVPVGDTRALSSALAAALGSLAAAS